MATQTAPAIPPRPSRSPNHLELSGGSSIGGPKIPPRPTARKTNRSVSPTRDSYAPSPLNEYPGGLNVSRTASTEPPKCSPSVTIPSLGEEGIEYADLEVRNASEDSDHPQPPAETRNIGSDLQLHAPKPSLPSASAKAKVQAVTRTDSHHFVDAGFGKSLSPAPDDSERHSRSLYTRANGSRADSSTASTDRRRSSLAVDEHSAPEIGQRVPMYPDAGAVQAPSPSPFPPEHAHIRPGRHHHRTRSGRELPPGSYGLHGHGVQPVDPFEKAWYEKHPDEYAKEEGQYGPGIGTPRPNWALSSDDLNKIVRSSAMTGSRLATSSAVVGTPEEEVGYIASEEYTSRLATPPPDHRRISQTAADSPLRKTFFPATDKANQPVVAASADREISEETGVIHVDDPYHPLHHPDGYSRTPEPDDLPHIFGESAIEDDEPILAADEVRPDSSHLQPAVSPAFERRNSFDTEPRSRTPSIHSRSSSRPSSLHGAMPGLVRFASRDERDEIHTPLEDLKEYEPLFPDDETEKRPLSAAERFRQRPDVLKHKFPSEDIWEDTPNSLQLHATVSTPELPKPDSISTFETPAQEEARRKQTKIDESATTLGIRISKDQDQEAADVRPSFSKQRFPSRDIWEDAPESQQLVATIDSSTEDQLKSTEAPTNPTVPPRPQQDVSSKPAISPTETRKPPTIPERPKPQIPVRPSKPIRQGSSDGQAKVTSPRTAGSADEPKELTASISTKPKPAVPARPVGNKIAALKAGFLSDLNSRLQLGPQGARPQAKKEENDTPAESTPLSDARKGRARGPARRKPADESSRKMLPPIPEIKITETWNVWQVGEDGNLIVGSGGNAAAKRPLTPESVEAAPALAKNMAGDSIDPQPSPDKETVPPSTEVTVSGKEDISPATTVTVSPGKEDVSSAAEVATPSEPNSTETSPPDITGTLEPESEVPPSLISTTESPISVPVAEPGVLSNASETSNVVAATDSSTSRPSGESSLVEV